LRPNGAVIKPFSLQDSISISADTTKHKVEWKSASDLSALRGNPVLLRFSMTNGRLYSFWVSRNEKGASGGFVAAGGPSYGGYVDSA
jgi:hypothetical protein